MKSYDFDADKKRVVVSGISLQAGQRLRAVLSCTLCPRYSIPVGEGNGTHADLDVWLRAPNGNLVDWASSYDAGCELFKYLVPSTASRYHIEVKHWNSDYCSELGGSYFPFVDAAGYPRRPMKSSYWR